MAKVAYLLGALALIIYLKAYFAVTPDFKINQCFLDTFSLNILYEKYPLIIYDILQDPEVLTETALKYSFVYKAKAKRLNYTFVKNLSKFTLVYLQEPSELHVARPGSELYTTIKLKAHQVVIVPYLWSYRSPKDMTCIELDDVLTKVVRLFCNTK